jgi:hypothetical protein
MPSENPKIAVLSANDEFVSAVRSANRELQRPAQILSVGPTDRDIDYRLGEADLVLADVEVLPLARVPRSRLYEILHHKPAIFFYPAEDELTYERTREAYRSGACDLVPMPKRSSQVAQYLTAFLLRPGRFAPTVNG